MNKIEGGEKGQDLFLFACDTFNWQLQNMQIIRPLPGPFDEQWTGK